MTLTGYVLLQAVVCAATAPAGEVVFREDFEGRGAKADLRARGWKIQATPDQSLWAVDQGVLKITHFHKPYKGGSIEHAVPVVRRGTLDFDAKIGGANNRHLSLQMYLYGMFVAFNGNGTNRIAWNRYCYKLVGGKKDGWRALKVRIAPDTRHHYRIAFDADTNHIEYYVDDMADPVFVDTDVPVLGTGKDKVETTGSIRLGNYGLCLGTVTTEVDNIVLRRTAARVATEAQADARDVLVFQGMAFERYRLGEVFGILKPPAVRRYLVQQGLGLVPRNAFRVERYTSRRTLDRAGLIVMADMPLGPGEVLPKWELAYLAKRVRAGATLVVLGGMWTLGKGRFEGTCLEPLLPVVLGGRWQVREASPALTLEPAVDALRSDLAWADKPAVMWYHDLKPTPDARVLLESGQRAMFVCRAHGRGRVGVFLGTPCGQAPAGMTAFWDWKDWPRLLARTITHRVEPKEARP